MILEDSNTSRSVKDGPTDSYGTKDDLDTSTDLEQAGCPEANLLKTPKGKTAGSSIPKSLSPQRDLNCRGEKKLAWECKVPHGETADDRTKCMKSQELHISCMDGSAPCTEADVLKTPNKKTKLGPTTGTALSHPQRSLKCRREIKQAWVEKDDMRENKDLL